MISYINKLIVYKFVKNIKNAKEAFNISKYF